MKSDELNRNCNIAEYLSRRQAGIDGPNINDWAEDTLVQKYYSSYAQLSEENGGCTISISFSPDGTTLATTHGDHTIKITEFYTGKLIRTLSGHERTPWTVKYHPINSNIVASGCLAGEVRVWDLRSGKCLYRTTLPDSVISISFHSSGGVLAIASGKRVFIWVYAQNSYPISNIEHLHNVRCVCFNPIIKDNLIIGITNRFPITLGHPIETTFSLKIWNIDMDAVMKGDEMALFMPRTLISRALLYNDGGFDLSACGRFFCGCAELWVETDPKPEYISFRSCVKPTNQGVKIQGNTFENSRTNIPKLHDIISYDNKSNKVHFRWPTLKGLPPLNPNIRQNSTPYRMPPLPSSDFSFSGLKRYLDEGSSPPQLKKSLCLPLEWDNTGPIPPVRTPDSPWGIECLNEVHKSGRPGKYVPHLVILQLRTGGPSCDHVWCTDRGGCELANARLLHKTDFEFNARGITSIKFSPSSRHILVSRGVRDGDGFRAYNESQPVTSIYRTSDLKVMDVLETTGEDVNCARFHPFSGTGFAYGSRQGGVRLLRRIGAP